jgi:hypothetical protein
MMVLKHPSSVLSIFISLILLTNSVSTLSNMPPTPASWAEDLYTVTPGASKIPSFTDMLRCEKDAMRSSFQPEGKRCEEVRNEREGKRSEEVRNEREGKRSEEVRNEREGKKGEKVVRKPFYFC